MIGLAGPDPCRTSAEISHLGPGDELRRQIVRFGSILASSWQPESRKRAHLTFNYRPVLGRLQAPGGQMKSLSLAGAQCQSLLCASDLGAGIFHLGGPRAAGLI